MNTFQTPSPVSVDIEVGVAVIRVVAEPRNTTAVEVRPSEPGKRKAITAAEQTNDEFTSGRVQIRCPRNWRQLSPWGGRGSVDIDIHLPTASNLSASTGVADLRATGKLDEVDYRTGVGNVAVDHAGSLRVKAGVGGVNAGRGDGFTEVKTGSGAVQLGTVAGTAVVKNANGDTTVDHVAGDLRVHSSNGRIVAERSDSTVVAKTSNGDIRLARICGGSASAHTARGQIEIGLPDGVAAWLDLQTHFGIVDNQLDSVDRPGPHDSTVEVRAQTAFGDNTVRRSPVPLAAPDS